MNINVEISLIGSHACKLLNAPTRKCQIINELKIPCNKKRQHSEHFIRPRLQPLGTFYLCAECKQLKNPPII